MTRRSRKNINIGSCESGGGEWREEEEEEERGGVILPGNDATPVMPDNDAFLIAKGWYLEEEENKGTMRKQ